MNTHEIKRLTSNHPERLIDKLKHKRTELEAVKTELGKQKAHEAKNERYGRFMKLFEPFGTIRYAISDRYNTPSVSLNWITAIELLTHFKIFERLLAIATSDSLTASVPASASDADDAVEIVSPHSRLTRSTSCLSTSSMCSSPVDTTAEVRVTSETKKGKNVNMYDNSGLPGCFILAIAHTILSRLRGSDLKLRFHWMANIHNENTPSLSEDEYDLFANYEDDGCWIGCGSTETEKGIESAIECVIEDPSVRELHLFVSNRRIEVGDQHDKQEEINTPMLYSQAYVMVHTLAQGGIAIFRIYGISTPEMIYLISILAGCFDNAFLCKPASSKQDNSESYFVGIGFDADIGDATAKQIRPIVNAYCNSTTEVKIDIATIAALPHLKSVFQFAEAHMNTQIETIKNRIGMWQRQETTMQHETKLRDAGKIRLEKWYDDVRLLPLDIRDWLIVKNTTVMQQSIFKPAKFSKPFRGRPNNNT